MSPKKEQTTEPETQVLPPSPLLIDFSASDEITVDGFDDIWAGTAFEKKDFTVTVKRISPGEITKIREKHTTVKRNKAKVDEEAVISEVFDRCLIRWTKFLDRNRKEILCNTENKTKMKNMDIAFAQSVYTLASESFIVKDEKSEDVDEALAGNS